MLLSNNNLPMLATTCLRASVSCTGLRPCVYLSYGQSTSSLGTGNVLKIQHLLHTCSEFHGNKEEEGGGKEEAAAGKDSDAGAKDASSSGGASGSGDGKATSKKAEPATSKKVGGAAKDVEMKDVEGAEAGSLGEPGAHQAISVLGIALIAMGEDIGAEMALRTFNHLVRCGKGGMG